MQDRFPILMLRPFSFTFSSFSPSRSSSLVHCLSALPLSLSLSLAILLSCFLIQCLLTPVVHSLCCSFSHSSRYSPAFPLCSSSIAISPWIPLMQHVKQVSFGCKIPAYKCRNRDLQLVDWTGDFTYFAV